MNETLHSPGWCVRLVLAVAALCAVAFDATAAFDAELEALKAEMAEARRVAMRPHAEAKSEKEHYDLSEKTSAAFRTAAAPIVARGIELARRQSAGSNSLQVLQWLLSDQGDSPAAEPAGALLLERHLQAPESLTLAGRYGSSATQWPRRVLRAIADAAKLSNDARALALFRLASGLQDRSDTIGDLKAAADAAQTFRELGAKYPTLKHRDRTWAEVARAHLFELENLAPGRVAPEIEGEDIDGARFKLSDFRGKVVLLDFWGDWCGPCREIYREGPELLRQHAGRPFALVGVNSDEERDKLRRRAREAGVTWRYFWDGGRIGGPIATRWNIQGWPMLYVIDHRGVIRAKYLRGSALDRLIAQCVDEAERDKGK